MMKKEINEEFYWLESKKDILDQIKKMKIIDEKTQISESDITHIFGEVDEKTDVGILFKQYIITITNWCILLKLFEKKEEYEICSEIKDMITILKKHYILFIDSYYGIKDDKWFINTSDQIQETIEHNTIFKEISNSLDKLNKDE